MRKTPKHNTIMTSVCSVENYIVRIKTKMAPDLHKKRSNTNGNRRLYGTRNSHLTTGFYGIVLTHFFLITLTVMAKVPRIEKQIARAIPACMPTSNPSCALILSCAKAANIVCRRTTRTNNSFIAAMYG